LVNGKIALRRERLHLQRMKFVWNGACYERLLVRNYSEQPLHVRLSFRFAADFADLFEVRGEQRGAHGTSTAALSGNHAVLLRYSGLDRIERATRIEFDPAPKALGVGRAAYELELSPHTTRRIFVRYGVLDEADWSGRVFYRQMRAARHALRESSARAASVDTAGSLPLRRNPLVQHPVRP
jgi:glycogen debranching enzyme